MIAFDKTSRFGSRVVLLLLGIGCLAIWFMRPDLLNFASPFGARVPTADRLELGWETQINAVRLGQSDRIEVMQEIIGNDHLLRLAGLTALRELLIEQGTITDEGLTPLTKLSGLQHLRLRGCRIHDSGLAQICTITSLKRLNLPQAELTDAGLESLADLHQLELLRIGSPRVTDAGVLQIAKVPTLRWLHLIDIPITDAALQPIGELKNLESLYLDGARISDTAYDHFFRTRSDLHVHIDQRHHDRDPHKAGHTH